MDICFFFFGCVNTCVGETRLYRRAILLYEFDIRVQCESLRCIVLLVKRCPLYVVVHRHIRIYKLCVCVCVYIYIYRERERGERERDYV